MKKIKRIVFSLILVMVLSVALSACQRTYSLTVNLDGGGSIFTGAGAGYKEGDEVTLTAQPLSGYVFDGWYDGDTCLSTESPYVFSMPSKNLRLVARFSRI